MAKRRKSVKKTVDKWKLKRTYKVVTPTPLGGKVVGEIISAEPSNLFNRVVPLSLADLLGADVNPQAFYITALLRIKDVGEDTVNTELVGHTTAFSYLRSIARRRKSIIHDSFVVKTKDGKTVRIKPILITLRKVSAIVKRNLRKALVEEVKKKAEGMNYYDLMKDIFNGNFTKALAADINKINPITHLIIKKVELEENLKEVAA